jgi:two-component system response regulator
MFPLNKTILVVEDNPDDETLIVRALTRYKLANEIVIKRDGAEALAYLLGEEGASSPPPSLPQVVLLDLKLPKVDGLEVLRRLRDAERTRLLPVVILTSSDEESDRMRGYALHANSYVQKPVEFSAFAEAVRELGLYWMVLNLPPV